MSTLCVKYHWSNIEFTGVNLVPRASRLPALPKALGKSKSPSDLIGPLKMQWNADINVKSLINLCNMADYKEWIGMCLITVSLL